MMAHALDAGRRRAGVREDAALLRALPRARRRRTGAPGVNGALLHRAEPARRAVRRRDHRLLQRRRRRAHVHRRHRQRRHLPLDGARGWPTPRPSRAACPVLQVYRRELERRGRAGALPRRRRGRVRDACRTSCRSVPAGLNTSARASACPPGAASPAACPGAAARNVILRGSNLDELFAAGRDAAVGRGGQRPRGRRRRRRSRSRRSTRATS